MKRTISFPTFLKVVSFRPLTFSNSFKGSPDFISNFWKVEISREGQPDFVELSYPDSLIWFQF